MKHVKTKNNLQLLKNSFGLCVRGVANSFSIDKICNLTFNINKIICHTTNEIIVSPKQNFTKQIEDFFTIENLGTDCRPKCGQCKCGKCSINNQLSIKEQRETNLILYNLQYDSIKKYWTVTYPWIRNPNKLPNNFPLAFALL